jgi:hypothetical protein
VTLSDIAVAIIKKLGLPGKNQPCSVALLVEDLLAQAEKIPEGPNLGLPSLTAL